MSLYRSSPLGCWSDHLPRTEAKPLAYWHRECWTTTASLSHDQHCWPCDRTHRISAVTLRRVTVSQVSSNWMFLTYAWSSLMFRHLWIWNKVSLNVCSRWASFLWQRSNTSVISWEIISCEVMVSLQSWLFIIHLLVSGIVVVDITDGQLVLILALLDIVLTLGHLVL